MFLSAFISSVFVLIQKASSQTLKTLTILLSVCTSEPSLTFQEASNVLLTNNNSVQNILKHCSNNKIKFESTIFPNYIHIPCPENILQCKNAHWTWSDRTDDVIRRMFPLVNIDNYLYKIYVLPTGCGFTGLGTLGPCSTISNCRIWIDGDVANNPMSYVHEIGHNLGLQHAQSKLNNAYNEYGDLSDFMGYCCGQRCLNAIHSSKLGFSTPLHSLYYPFPLQKISLGKNEYITILINGKTWYVQNRKGDSIDNVVNTVNVYGIEESKSVLYAILENVGDTFTSIFTVTLIEKKSDQVTMSFT